MSNHGRPNASQQYYNAAQQQQRTGAVGRPRGYGMGKPVQGAAGMPMPQPQFAAYQAGGPVYQQPGFPTPSQPPQGEKKKKKKGAAFWIAIIVAILAIVLAIILAITLLGNQRGARTGDLGQLEGKTPAEIQAELDRVVEEGMFNISIASVVEFPDGTSPGELRIENVPNNNYLMKVAITRADTGEQLYETGVIEPNHHIQEDTLDVDLPKGTYDCLATFTALDPETEEAIGEVAAQVTFNVLA